MHPCALWCQFGRLAKNLLLAFQDGHSCPWNGMVRIESDDQTAFFPDKARYSRKIGARDSTNLSHRHPILRKVNYLARLKKSIGLLIAKQARLHLEISAVIVGEGFAPVQPVSINSPGPDFSCRNFFVVRKMCSPRIGVRTPHPHEIFPASIAEHRNGTFRVIAHNAVVL